MIVIITTTTILSLYPGNALGTFDYLYHRAHVITIYEIDIIFILEVR